MAILLPTDLWGKLVHRLEAYILRANRRRGHADYKDQSRYPLGDRQALFDWCAESTGDLFAYLQPQPGDVAQARVEVVAGPGRPHEIVHLPSPLPSGVAENDRVVAHRWRAGGPSEGTIVFHHPAFHNTVEWMEWFSRSLRRRFDVVLMEAPFHLSRTPRGWFSGERLINPDPRHLFEGMRQWMADHATLLAYLEAQAVAGDPGARPIGVVGYSLGAFLSLLHAHFRPELPVVAICSTNDYAHGLYEGELGEILRARIGELGLSREDWETLTGSLKLHLLARHIPGERVCLISGIHERVEPFASIERFHNVFVPRRKMLLPFGHATVAILGRGRVVREITRFVDEVRALDGNG